MTSEEIEKKLTELQKENEILKQDVQNLKAEIFHTIAEATDFTGNIIRRVTMRGALDKLWQIVNGKKNKIQIIS